LAQLSAPIEQTFSFLTILVLCLLQTGRFRWSPAPLKEELANMSEKPGLVGDVLNEFFRKVSESPLITSSIGTGLVELARDGKLKDVSAVQQVLQGADKAQK
jgi:hypothetical protein